MPKIKFTKAKIDSLKHPDTGQVIYWDTVLINYSRRKLRGIHPKHRLNSRQVKKLLGWFSVHLEIPSYPLKLR